MTLCDTGPLVALIDRGDKHHHICNVTLPTLTPPLLTTWPCLTEAMYLLGAWAGHLAQERLWDLVEKKVIVLHKSSDVELSRMRVLMTTYSDTPMDLADASLVAAAEALNLAQIFTTDHHFRIYQINGNKPFDVVP